MRFDLPDLNLKPWPEWEAQRQQWIALAEECLYGRAPERPQIRTEVLDRTALWDGRGTKETVRIRYGSGERACFDAEIYAPSSPGKHPVITWNQFSRHDWDDCPYQEVTAGRGYILAAFEREQAAADSGGGGNPAYEAFPGYDWGAVRAWAWAQSLLADYLLTREDTDPDKLVCTGFSRGGKAALAAGITDQRFSICAPICSGAAGCGCFRYLGTREGFCQDVNRVESLGRIGSVFPHWWTKAFSRWWPEPDPKQMGLEQEFPFDSHTLKALIAPRVLFTLEGLDDDWSNPRGTALTWRAAQPAFDLLGGLNVAHFRPGGHRFSAEDWRTLLDFCDEVYSGSEPSREWNNCPFPPEG